MILSGIARMEGQNFVLKQRPSLRTKWSNLLETIF